MLCSYVGTKTYCRAPFICHIARPERETGFLIKCNMIKHTLLVPPSVEWSLPICVNCLKAGKLWNAEKRCRQIRHTWLDLLWSAPSRQRFAVRNEQSFVIVSEHISPAIRGVEESSSSSRRSQLESWAGRVVVIHETSVAQGGLRVRTAAVIILVTFASLALTTAAAATTSTTPLQTAPWLSPHLLLCQVLHGMLLRPTDLASSSRDLLSKKRCRVTYWLDLDKFHILHFKYRWWPTRHHSRGTLVSSSWYETISHQMQIKIGKFCLRRITYLLAQGVYRYVQKWMCSMVRG